MAQENPTCADEDPPKCDSATSTDWLVLLTEKMKEDLPPTFCYKVTRSEKARVVSLAY